MKGTSGRYCDDAGSVTVVVKAKRSLSLATREARQVSQMKAIRLTVVIYDSVLCVERRGGVVN